MPNNPNANTNLIPFKKGHDERRNYGGRPRKLVSKLGDFGYTKFEVEETIRIMLALTIDELKDIIVNPDTTMLEALLAAAIIKDGQHGRISTVEALLNRLHGKTPPTKEQSQTEQIEIIIPGDDGND